MRELFFSGKGGFGDGLWGVFFGEILKKSAEKSRKRERLEARLPSPWINMRNRAVYVN